MLKYAQHFSMAKGTLLLQSTLQCHTSDDHHGMTDAELSELGEGNGCLQGDAKVFTREPQSIPARERFSGRERRNI